MSYFNGITRISLKDLDAAATGATQIGTTENGTMRFYPLFMVTKIRSATALAVGGTMSVGTNASTYNNVIAATALTGLDAVNKMMRTDMTTALGSIAANTAIYANLTVAFTATACRLDVDLFGYYE